MNQVTNTIKGVIDITWPMIIISIVVLVSLRITYLIKNKQHLTLYRELLTLSFIIYILCLFQIVTFQDEVNWSSNNFIPFKEMFRYELGSRLFLKNVIGNMLLFLPFGFFTTHYLKCEKPYIVIFITIIVSVAIELVQMAIGRVFDIDDIILNIVGGTLGYFLYSILRNIGNKLPKVFKSEVFLNIVSVIILLGVISLIV